MEAAYQAYHKSMCLGERVNDPNHPYSILMDFWRQIHLPPETTTIDLILKLVATMKQVLYIHQIFHLLIFLSILNYNLKIYFLVK